MRMVPSGCDSDYGCCASVVLDRSSWVLGRYFSDHTRGPFTDLSAQNGGDHEVLTFGGPGGTRRSTTHHASVTTSFEGCCSERANSSAKAKETRRFMRMVRRATPASTVLVNPSGRERSKVLLSTPRQYRTPFHREML